MVENTALTWVKVPVAELCMNHFGSRLRFKSGGLCVEGVVFGMLLFAKEDHKHVQVGLRVNGGELAQMDLDADESVEISLEKA